MNSLYVNTVAADRQISASYRIHDDAALVDRGAQSGYRRCVSTMVLSV